MTKKLAFLVSRVFGPESTISIGIWALMSFATDLVWEENLWFVGVMLLVNLIIPIGVYGFFFLTKRITDIEVTDRRERPPVLITVQVVYSFGLVLSYYFATEFYFSIALWVYLSLLIATMISLFWKISLHMVGNTMFFLLAIELLKLPIFLAVLALLVVAWSRLVLEKHTSMQLAAGTILPAVLYVLLR